jgi:hypothetical protein
MELKHTCHNLFYIMCKTDMKNHHFRIIFKNDAMENYWDFNLHMTFYPNGTCQLIATGKS